MSKIDLQQKMKIAIPLYFFASINQTVCMLIMLGANHYSFEIRKNISKHLQNAKTLKLITYHNFKKR